MLFNSYEFLFAFLPATLVIFFLLGRFAQVISLPSAHKRELLPTGAYS